MKATTTTAVLGLALLLPLATGCAGRQAPFDDLSNSQVTILKLQGQPQPSVLPTTGGTGGLPFAIPGLTPEQQAQINAGIGGIGAAVGQIIPGLPIPGMTGGTTPVTQPQQTFNGFVVQGSSPASDDLKEELLDVFGKSDNFNQTAGQCFTPGMGVVFSDPAKGNVELMVSFSCNAVKGNGFNWPHPNFGMTAETSGKLRQIYQQMFMQPPPNPGG